jgi:hypothetical protein
VAADRARTYDRNAGNTGIMVRRRDRRNYPHSHSTWPGGDRLSVNDCTALARQVCRSCWGPAPMNPGSQERIRTDTAVGSKLVVADSIRAQGSKRAADSSRPVAVHSRAEVRQIRCQAPSPSPSHHSRASPSHHGHASLPRASLPRASLRHASLRHANRPHHHDHALRHEHWRQTEPGPKRQP